MEKEHSHPTPANSPHRKVRLIILTIIRIMLIIIVCYAYYNSRPLVLVISSLALVLTFIPIIVKKVFKKESPAIFDIVLMSFIFLILAFWEIWGVYSNAKTIALLMNFFEAIVVGLTGLTLVYAFFKYENMEHNIRTLSIFAFCLSFTIGTFLEIGEIALDAIFKFRIHEAGLYGTTGDIALYALGSFVVSLTGYRSLKKGKTILISKFLEEFIENNPKIFGIHRNNKNQMELIREIIQNGENHRTEFKSALRKNIHTNSIDKNIEHSALKTLNAYMNTQGGTLLIGVSDKKEILGLDHDQFTSQDQAQRHLMQLVSDYLGPENIKLVDCQIVPFEDKHVLKVECKKSNKEVFLKNGNTDEFYVRQGPLSKQLTGSDMLKYVESNFRNN